MQAWNIQLRAETGHAVNAWQATLRYLVAVAQWLVILMAIWLAREHGPLATAGLTAAALFALGLSQFHPRRWMLHDWLSGTELVRIPGLARPRWKRERKT
jgi:uncharacterized RDD family membrane protein YckC